MCSVSASKIESFLVLHLLNCLNCLFPFLKSLGDCNCSHSQAPSTELSPSHAVAARGPPQHCCPLLLEDVSEGGALGGSGSPLLAPHCSMLGSGQAGPSCDELRLPLTPTDPETQCSPCLGLVRVPCVPYLLLLG